MKKNLNSDLTKRICLLMSFSALTVWHFAGTTTPVHAATVPTTSAQTTTTTPETPVTTTTSEPTSTTTTTPTTTTTTPKTTTSISTTATITLAPPATGATTTTPATGTTPTTGTTTPPTTTTTPTTTPTGTTTPSTTTTTTPKTTTSTSTTATITLAPPATGATTTTPPTTGTTTTSTTTPTAGTTTTSTTTPTTGTTTPTTTTTTPKTTTSISTTATITLAPPATGTTTTTPPTTGTTTTPTTPPITGTTTPPTTTPTTTPTGTTTPPTTGTTTPATGPAADTPITTPNPVITTPLMTYDPDALPTPGGLVIIHYENASHQPIGADTVLDGDLGTFYQSTPKTIAGYSVRGIQGFASGFYTQAPRELTYVYTKDAVASAQTTTTKKEGALTVRFEDSDGQKLTSDQTLKGKVGTAYQLGDRTIPGYSLTAISSSAEGTFTTKPKQITYVYEKLATATQAASVINETKATTTAPRTLAVVAMGSTRDEVATAQTEAKPSVDGPITTKTTADHHRLHRHARRDKLAFAKLPQAGSKTQTNLMWVGIALIAATVLGFALFFKKQWPGKDRKNQ